MPDGNNLIMPGISPCQVSSSLAAIFHYSPFKVSFITVKGPFNPVI